MANITCIWCGSQYKAFSDNRRHCKNRDCRQKEIEANLNDLSKLISMVLRHKIATDIELRLPGNDTIGKQAKINSSGNIDINIKKNGEPGTDLNKQILTLKSYFRSLLWKGIKGNFMLKTNGNGKIYNIIPHETFVNIKNPVILGDNKLIYTLESFPQQQNKKEVN